MLNTGTYFFARHDFLVEVIFKLHKIVFSKSLLEDVSTIRKQDGFKAALFWKDGNNVLISYILIIYNFQTQRTL